MVCLIGASKTDLILPIAFGPQILILPANPSISFQVAPLEFRLLLGPCVQCSHIVTSDPAYCPSIAHCPGMFDFLVQTKLLSNESSRTMPLSAWMKKRWKTVHGISRQPDAMKMIGEFINDLAEA